MPGDREVVYLVHRVLESLSVVEGTEGYVVIKAVDAPAQAVHPALFFFKQNVLGSLTVHPDLFKDYPAKVRSLMINI